MAFASDAIIAKGREVAAHAMETASADIQYADAEFVVAGTDRKMSLFEVARAALDPARLPDGVEPGLNEKYEHEPEAATYPNGTHICELEIDAATGTVEILRYTAVDDFGAIVNPLLLAGQVHGGVAQGIGQALLEHAKFDAEGQILTGSFMDYALPRADNMPDYDFTTFNHPCKTNPLGIKGAGEAGAIGAPPAVINAVIDALAPAIGPADVDMPASPAYLWGLLNRRAAA